jgi:hypothetical protein
VDPRPMVLDLPKAASVVWVPGANGNPWYGILPSPRPPPILLSAILAEEIMLRTQKRYGRTGGEVLSAFRLPQGKAGHAVKGKR